MCTLPCVSVCGTRCTRCTPASNFKVPYTSAPSTSNWISLYPPLVPSLKSTTLTFQPLLSQYLVYMRCKSPAKILASSPPVPALTSTTAFLVSSGSLGISINLISSSSFPMVDFASSSCILAISTISASLPSARISSASFTRSVAVRYPSRLSISALKSLYSLFNWIYCFWSLIISGWIMRSLTSSNLFFTIWSFSNILKFSYWNLLQYGFKFTIK